MWETTGHKPEELETPPPPDDLAYLIGWLGELRSPVTYTELHHWASLTHRHLLSWEAEALVRLDQIRNPP